MLAEHPSLRVLIADDYYDALKSTACLLRLSGHDVEEALSGSEAIARTSAFLPDVVMLDIGMPVMDGYETARRIRSLALPKSPTLVAVSAWGDAASRRRAVEAGFDLHLQKPVPPAVFGELWMLVERRGELAEQLARLNAQRRHGVADLMDAYIETCNTLLDVANTTMIDALRERCIAEVGRVCERVHSWVVHTPYLNSPELRRGLAHVMQRLPPKAPAATK